MTDGQWIPAKGSWVVDLGDTWLAGTLVRVVSNAYTAWRWNGGPGEAQLYVWVQSRSPISTTAWLSDLRLCTPEELAQLALSPAGQLEGL